MLPVQDDVLFEIWDLLSNKDLVMFMNTCRGYRRQLPRGGSYLTHLRIPITVRKKAEAFMVAYGILYDVSTAPGGFAIEMRITDLGDSIRSVSKALEYMEKAEAAMDIIMTKYLFPLIDSTQTDENVWNILRYGKGAVLPRRRWYRHRKPNLVDEAFLRRRDGSITTDLKANVVRPFISHRGGKWNARRF